MGFRGLFEGWHLVILLVVVVVLFGGKRLPDAARGIGRSLRIFKSEIKEMQEDGKKPSSGSDALEGRVVDGEARGATPTEQRRDLS